MRRVAISERTPWHVIIRGARRLQLFHDTEDYQVFLNMLRASCADAATECVVYALLSNHGHLSLIGNSLELTDCMRHLDRGYSGYHNKKYGLGGHTFDQAYFAKPIRNGYILQRVARYIHLNPVRAGISACPEDYRWSDYSRLIQNQPDRYATGHATLLETFAGDGDDRLASYVECVRAGLRMPRRARPTTQTALELWQEQFLWILELAESRKPDDRLEAVRGAMLAAANAGIPPRAIAYALGEENGLRVSQVLYRTRKLLSRQPELAEVIAPLDVL